MIVLSSKTNPLGRVLAYVKRQSRKRSIGGEERPKAAAQRIRDGNPRFEPLEAPSVSAADSLRVVKRLRRFEGAQLDRPDSAGVIHLAQDFRPLPLLHEHIG